MPAVDRIYTVIEGKGITGELCSGKPCTEAKAAVPREGGVFGSIEFSAPVPACISRRLIQGGALLFVRNHHARQKLAAGQRLVGIAAELILYVAVLISRLRARRRRSLRAASEEWDGRDCFCRNIRSGIRF